MSLPSGLFLALAFLHRQENVSLLIKESGTYLSLHYLKIGSAPVPIICKISKQRQ
jgi:hypothetical protein